LLPILNALLLLLLLLLPPPPPYRLLPVDCTIVQ
jgi:hypothetical protein